MPTTISLRPLKAGLAAAALGFSALTSLHAATIPYSNDFSGSGSNTAFPNEGSDWNVTGGSYVYSTTSTNWTASAASVPLTNIAANTPFTIQTQFTVSSVGRANGNGETIGLGFFGLTSNFAGASDSSYYLADWYVAGDNTANVGTLRILSLGDGSGFTNTNVVVDDNTSSANIALTLDATYTLRLVGTYTGTTLNMTLSILDASGVQIGGSATASDTSPLTGQYFGYRNRVGMSGGTFTAAFEDYSVAAVPEPGTVALLGLGAGALVVMMRRRSRAV